MPKTTSPLGEEGNRVPRLGDFLQSFNAKVPVHEFGSMYAEELKATPIGSKARIDMLEALARMMTAHEKGHPEPTDEEISVSSDEQLLKMIEERLKRRG